MMLSMSTLYKSKQNICDALERTDTVEPFLSGHLKIDKTMILMTNVS